MLSLVCPNRIFHLRKPHKTWLIVVGSSSSSLEEDRELGFPCIREAKRVVLVRHGQSTWNEEGRIQGSSNFSVLTQKGVSQAHTCRQMLVNDVFHICFSSPLNRSKRTAQIIWDGRNEEIITDNDLREIDLYSFQGLLKHEGKSKFGDAYTQWQSDAPNFRIDGHYPVRELWARARSCWNRILAHESRSVLVVAHNAVNQALVATAMGLGTEYFRVLLQSNCGVSVLDFTPRSDGGSPYICLNRLNQTPNSPTTGGSSVGRKTSKQIILVCHGSSQSDSESQKNAEILLDVRVKTIVSSPNIASLDTANAIARVQEAADCLGADSVPRYVKTKQTQDLNVENILQQKDSNEALEALWDRSGKAWKSLLEELSDEPQNKHVIVVVAHPILHIALMAHCLNLTKERMGSFHLDEGSISILDFPDGPTGKGVIRCINYTAHLGRWSKPITRST